MESIVTRFQRIQKFLKGRDAPVGCGFQQPCPRIKSFHILNSHAFIRTKRWNHTEGLIFFLSVLLMVCQQVGWVVGGCDKLHSAFFQNFYGSKLPARQHLVALLPDTGSRFSVQETIPDSERFSKLHVSPVIKRIPYCFR